MQKLVSLQLNELNFEYIERYIELGELPHFAKFFKQHGFSRTDSEVEHHLANPWIQWPTVHTGLDYADHGVFRLGDIMKIDDEMIYDVVERNGFSVAALSAFNCQNNTKNPIYFIPDPWTKTRVDGSKDLRRLYDALCQVTDDYAKNKISLNSIANLILGGLPNMNLARLPNYIKEASQYFFAKKKWYRALVADRLLADTFITKWKKFQPDFSTIFINGAAHLQHHYLYSSKVCTAPLENPEWHCPKGEDPFLDILRLYDQILGDFVEMVGDNRLTIVTGLHQEAHERVTYYFRIDDHESFMRKIGINFTNSYRLMTEDFVLKFKNAEDAAQAQQQIADVRSINGDPIFYVETGDKAIRTLNTAPNIFHIENRGSDLYIQLRPSNQAITKGMKVKSGDVVIDDFDQLVSFAQFKNCHHVGEGYYADNAKLKGELPRRFPLRDTFGMVLDHFNITDENPRRLKYKQNQTHSSAAEAQHEEPALA